MNTFRFKSQHAASQSPRGLFNDVKCSWFLNIYFY